MHKPVSSYISNVVWETLQFFLKDNIWVSNLKQMKAGQNNYIYIKAVKFQY